MLQEFPTIGTLRHMRADTTPRNEKGKSGDPEQIRTADLLLDREAC